MRQSGHKKLYCSKTCGRRHDRLINGPHGKKCPSRKCEACGAEFRRRKKPKDDARFCSRKCSARIRGAKRTANKKPKQLQLPRSFNCGYCTVEFIPRNTLQVFCSTECSSAHAKAARESRRVPRSTKTCKVCGNSFLPTITSNGMRCSRQSSCSRKCARKGRIQKIRFYKRIRRNRERLAFVEVIDIRRLMQRDHRICQICWNAVLDVPVPHYLAPTIDHVQPISLGGKHEYSNVRLAHFICNSLRGNGLTGAGRKLQNFS